MKICSECNTAKELTDFGLNRGQCKPCRAAYSSKYRKENKETVNAGNRQYRADNRELTNGYSSKWAKANPKKMCAKQLKYAKKHPDKVNARKAKRRAAQLQRTPNWLTGTNWTQIEMFYTAANTMTKEIGIKFEVDHIEPILGENVSGLHVPWNLQILPKSLNASKGNR